MLGTFWGHFSQLQIQIKKNLNLNLYREIPRNSNPIKISIRLCTVRYREIWFSRFWLVDENLPTIQNFDYHLIQHLMSHLPRNGLYREKWIQVLSLETCSHSTSLLSREVIALLEIEKWSHSTSLAREVISLEKHDELAREVIALTSLAITSLAELEKWSHSR